MKGEREKVRAGGEESAAAKKKKKKKGKKEDEPAPTPAASKKKGGISALKAMMEQKKRLEEEARQRLEDERKRIEEEEKRAEEEARRKEEERLRKKEKEKVWCFFLQWFLSRTNLDHSTQAKREQAKREGTLLTKKQKEEKAAAERRKQALLASGVQIEGLQTSAASPVGKKVMYGNRKKKGPAGAAPSSAQASPALVSRPLSPELTPEPSPAPTPAAKVNKLPANEDLKSDRDESSDDETKPPAADADVKDSWDASSEDEDVRPNIKTDAGGMFSSLSHGASSANICSRRSCGFQTSRCCIDASSEDPH